MISAPRQEDPAAARQTRLRAFLPLLVLAAGLLVVLIVVGADPDITVARLRDLTSTLYLPQDVGTIYKEFNFPPIDPFAGDLAQRGWLETVAFEVVYLTSTTAIGSPVVAAIRGDDVWPAPVRILAGFLPGYLIVLAPLQLLFVAVPLASASWIGLAALPVAAIALHRRALVAGLRDVRLGVPRRGGAAIAAAGATAFVLVALVHRLQQGIFYLTQDSISYFLNIDRIMVAGRAEYLAHWQTQTDEWVYNAPLTLANGHDGDLWFVYYVTQGIATAAFLCLVYGVVHRVARRRKALAGALAVAATFGSTLAIYPWVYTLIVGGGQPELALAHPGRLIGIIAPWVAVLIVLNPRRAPVLALALATLGLAFTNLNNVLYVGVALAAVVLWRGLHARPSGFAPAAVRVVVHGSLGLALALPIAAFSFTRGTPSGPIVPVLMLAGASAAAVVGAALVAWGTASPGVDGPRVGRRELRWVAVWVATAVVGLLISDNLVGGSLGRSVHELLAHVLPGYGAPVAKRTELTGGVFAGLSFPTFSQDACNANVTCGGIPYFLVGYGVLFSLIAATWVGYGRLRTDAEQTNLRRAATLLLLAAIPVVLILVFFTGADTLRSATFTRMLEWPYYSLLVLGVLAFCEARDRRVMIGGVAFLAVWTIVPLISYEWPEQMVRNAGWYLDRLL
ncbi:hypothetical protein [Baekduia sp. Peel2402]|uniref:hypothetical protein n=1 Tax=Baekduia sp. Peel2402 TaxID=3458296 RepID=UPI00403E535D